MRTIAISGTLEYRFTGVEIKVPDAIDIDDESVLMNYLDGNLDYADVRQQSDEELVIDGFEEYRPE